ncbi:LamG-like jellyroll fold domain-containing protein [Adhaeribacter radiodurans]|uniref:Gliding motility-associated C-terminal domain-containing protein n=1 Tax=Adhaeribacter radiodurans TaxID=2745197 RepID=A0A7L7LCJ5_9BACT|nr:LamG-like jellyroll fold domain-containing protein [Adhaeribacter radiodurans]QMU30467.1 gliding motility-associated C-terminal domain-containing protein [Adhaeribacter radiodurans]
MSKSILYITFCFLFAHWQQGWAHILLNSTTTTLFTSTFTPPKKTDTAPHNIFDRNIHLEGISEKTAFPEKITLSPFGIIYNQAYSSSNNFALIPTKANETPEITTQPVSVTINSDENASFTVVASGDPLSYQWQVDTGNGTFANITNNEVYSGATTATLTITSAPYSMNNYTYRVQISDGEVVTSDNAVLTITKRVPVITQPKITIPAIAEDLAKEQNLGAEISSLLAGAVSSPEGLEIGIAVTGRDVTNGTWEFFQNNTWYTFDLSNTPADANALLLPPTAKIRFVPTANFNGTASFTFRAWDQSAGTAYSVADITTGDTTAYSAASGTATITVSAVNDEPVITSSIRVNGLNFDGTKGYVSIPELNLEGDYTIEAWVNVAQHQTWARVADLGNGPNQDNILATFNTAQHLEMQTFIGGNQGSSLAANSAFPTGVWKHVAVVNNGAGTGTLYIDGLLVGSGNQNVPRDAVRALNYLAKSNWANDAYFNGKMREVRIWDVARTQTQIQESKDLQLAGNEEGLEVYYKFAEGTGTTLTDATTNGKNGTIHEGATWAVEAFPVTSVTTPEDTEHMITGVQVSDPDAGSEKITLTLNVANGIIKIKNDVSNGIAAGDITTNNSNAVTINAPLAAINETLAKNGLIYAPNANYSGTDNLVLTLNDNGLAGAGGSKISSLTITVIVEPINDIPVITSTPISSASEGNNYAYTLTATDADVTDKLIFSAPILPGWLSFNAATGVLSGIPKQTDAGTHPVTLRVTDGKITLDQTFTITVGLLPLAPVIVGVTEDTGNNTDGITADNSLILRGTAQSEVTVKIVATGLGDMGTTTSDGAGNWAFTFANVLPDGVYSFTANAINAANQDGPFSAPFRVEIDTKAPETTILSAPLANSSSTAAIFDFASSEAESGFEVSLDNAAYVTSTNRLTLTSLAEGTHELKVRALDKAGNIDVTPASHTWTIDLNAPTVTISTTAPTPINVPFEVTITFSEEVNNFDATDLTLKNATATAFTAVSKQIYTAVIAPIADGEVTVNVAAAVAQDGSNSGNVASNELKIIFDATKPTGYAVSFEQPQIDVTNQGNITLKITGAEIGTTYFYTITGENSGTPVTGTGLVEQAQFDITALNLTELPNGPVTVSLYLVDAAGNQGETITNQIIKNTKDVVAIKQSDNIRVPLGTPFQQLPLPVTLEVTYSSGEKEEVPVTWQPGSYNPDATGQYELTGILTLSSGTTNLNNIPAKIIVSVESNQVPTAITLSNTTFSPNVTPSDAIGKLETADADDTQFTYTLVTGQGDTHNGLFNIVGDQLFLKSNAGLSGQTQFTIRVKSTDSFNNSIEQSFTLTKAAYPITADQLKIVNAFSPNGDGINDEWTIPELKFYNQVQIEVFDRSGVRLFYTTDPEKGWNGQNANGKVLPGSYLFIIQVADINLTKKGVVTVLKK